MTVHLRPEARERSTSHRWFEDNRKLLVDELGFVLKSYPQNAMIGCRSDNGDRVFLIYSGWGCLYSGLPNGERQVIDFPLKGDIVVPRGRRDDTSEILTARTALVVLEISATKLFIGLARSPDLSAALWEAISRQRSILAQHFTSVGCRRALARVAHFLLELAVRLEQTGEVTLHGYRCPLTQYDFANALGLTLIHVNRKLRELRERELVEFRHGQVRFLNRRGLERLSGFDAVYLR